MATRIRSDLQSRVELGMRMSTQLIQAIELLELPALQLREVIQQELEQNPVLEIQEEDEKPSKEEGEEEWGSDGAQESLEQSTVLQEIEDHGGQDGLPRFSTSNSEGTDPDRKWSLLENQPEEPDSLGKYLLGQVVLLELTAKQEAFAEFIIYALDTDGYLRVPLRELVHDFNALRLEKARSLMNFWEKSGCTEPLPLGNTGEKMDSRLPPRRISDRGNDKGESGNGTGEQGKDVQDSLSLDFVHHVWRLFVSPDRLSRFLPELELQDELVRDSDAEEALRGVQSLSPPGIAARDLKECLFLQLSPADPAYQEKRYILEHLLNRQEEWDAEGLAQAVQKEPDQVKEWITECKRLVLIPALTYLRGRRVPLVPDVKVFYSEGEYVVQLERSWIPSLMINPRYGQLLKKRETVDRGTLRFIKDKITLARSFIRAIEDRHARLLSVARVIVEEQRAFLDQGLTALKPLHLEEVAARLGVHISTVSRVISDKYMETPRGLFSFKFFFSSSARNSNQLKYVRLPVFEKLKEMIEHENRQRPLSDLDLVKKFQEAGLALSRRTISKYRKMTNIPSRSKRLQLYRLRG